MLSLPNKVFLGAVAQLVAHLHGMQGVRGSSPLSSTHGASDRVRRLHVGQQGPVKDANFGWIEPCQGRIHPEFSW